MNILKIAAMLAAIAFAAHYVVLKEPVTTDDQAQEQTAAPEKPSNPLSDYVHAPLDKANKVQDAIKAGEQRLRSAIDE